MLGMIGWSLHYQDGMRAMDVLIGQIYILEAD